MEKTTTATQVQLDELDSLVMHLATTCKKISEPTAINITQQYSLGVRKVLGGTVRDSNDNVRAQG